jgi:hypothetical protein
MKYSRSISNFAANRYRNKIQKFANERRGVWLITLDVDMLQNLTVCVKLVTRNERRALRRLYKLVAVVFFFVKGKKRQQRFQKWEYRLSQSL